MTADISRHSLRPAQKYTGVVRQQGRLPLDAEETEAEELISLSLRQAIAETICARGSPNRGFRIHSPQLQPPLPPNQALDFAIEAGSFYLGGLRFVTANQQYRSQPDWLDFSLDAPGPSLPMAGQQRTDLIWLDGREQTLTATEDAELFERALGGADSGARRRPLQRVRVLQDVPADCSQAVVELLAREFPGASLDAEGVEVLSGARLQVGFTQLEPLQDLCRPSAQAGFLGARNESFRVQVSRPGHFVWGRDNAAPLYRVQVEDDGDGDRRQLRFLTPPRDEFGWPLAGMTVELLPWGAQLDNSEKMAAPQGTFLRVVAGYDPASEAIVVGADVPANWETWLAANAAVNPRDPPEQARYFYLRVWTGGGAGAAVDHAIDLLNPVALGDTGLTAQFSGSGLPGDYWVIAARPNTPTEVSPWALLDGMAPMGPRRLLAPLALLPWNGPVPGTPLDCRHRFRSVCRNQGCCVIVVGDEHRSHGDVSSLQEAVDLLPDSGGTICVLPGRYPESVHIRARHDIRIHGCDARSRVVGKADRPSFLIENCEDIAIEHLGIEAGPLSAVQVIESRRIALRQCVIQMRDMASLHAAVFARGEDLRIEGNLIDTLAQPNAASATPAAVLDGPCDGAAPAPPAVLAHASRGGVQLGGGCERVQVLDNAIRGGIGNGITLGSLLVINENGEPEEQPDLPGATDPCAPCRPLDSSGDDDEVDRLRVASAGDLYDIEIRGNRIEQMGANGIAVVRYFNLKQAPLLVTVHGLRIIDNHIEACLRRDIATPGQALQGLIGYGGIALAFATDLRIEGNDILRNGASQLDPVCGVFALAVQHLQVHGNRILDNGPRLRDEPDDALGPGNRGGIWVWLAIAPQLPKQRSAKRVIGQQGLAAASIRDNQVVVPVGRCLTLFALGGVSILDNHLHSQGSSGRGLDFIATHSLVGNLGISNEWTLGLVWMLVLSLFGKLPQLSDNFGPCELAKWLGLLGNEGQLQPPLSRRWATGKTLFQGNQARWDGTHESPLWFALSSVLIASLDDVGVHANQFEVETTYRLFLTDLLALGGSVRVADNRLSETWMRAFFSGLSAGLMNTTTDNQATHCLGARSLLSNLLVFRDNLSLVEHFCPQECGRPGRVNG